MVRLAAWLMGVRLIERGDGYIVVKLPFWLRDEATVRKIGQSLTADAEVVGKRVKVTHGRRLVRFEVEKACER